MMKNNVLIWVVLGILFIIFFGYKNRNNILKYLTIEKVNTDTIIETKTDTLWKDTTIWKYKLMPVKEEIIRHDTIKCDSTPIILPITSKAYTDTICANNDSAIVQSYISGYKPNLDSLRVYMKKQEIIKTNTVEITKYIEKPKKLLDRIHLQPQVTGGYDIINKQWGVTAGIGVGIDLY